MHEFKEPLADLETSLEGDDDDHDPHVKVYGVLLEHDRKLDALLATIGTHLSALSTAAGDGDAVQVSIELEYLRGFRNELFHVQSVFENVDTLHDEVNSSYKGFMMERTNEGLVTIERQFAGGTNQRSRLPVGTAWFDCSKQTPLCEFSL